MKGESGIMSLGLLKGGDEMVLGCGVCVHVCVPAHAQA